MSSDFGDDQYAVIFVVPVITPFVSDASGEDQFRKVAESLEQLCGIGKSTIFYP